MVLEGWKRSRELERAQNGAGELIPTWQVGHEQPQANDLKRYAEEGYSKNSLIYSCVREIATSFAPLHAQVLRRGQPAEGHRMVQLLQNPNTKQDEAEFQDELASHYEVAGNAYVHMVRESASRARRREYAGFPVQELQLIRPDYVTIEPGATWEQDVFLVTVGDRVRARIPRADIIHIPEPNLINDFYGLSKVALLVREGSIDLEMSDFELSFYRNAGVPMGLLNVKGRSLRQNQIDEVKSNFRRAYNGVKHWFDLLVLNSDEASFTQLGMAPKDMESNETRFHVESRICGVYGVPGLLVGARFALSSAQAGNYEQAQFQFWSETMLPLSARIAGAWQKRLLPEFATTRDATAEVAYDLTGVRALQEDRSRKLREVVRLVLTGAFSTHQALRLVGLPVSGEDFYMRNGNQVVVGLDGTITPMTAPAEEGTDTPNPDNPLEGAAFVDLERLFARVPLSLS